MAWPEVPRHPLAPDPRRHSKAAAALSLRRLAAAQSVPCSTAARTRPLAVRERRQILQGAHFVARHEPVVDRRGIRLVTVLRLRTKTRVHVEATVLARWQQERPKRSPRLRCASTPGGVASSTPGTSTRGRGFPTGSTRAAGAHRARTRHRDGYFGVRTGVLGRPALFSQSSSFTTASDAAWRISRLASRDSRVSGASLLPRPKLP